MEGLRLDEAMHPLALLCVGMYGETLPPQDGAPGAHRAAVEVRVQEHQIHRQDQLGEKPAAHHLEYSQRRDEYGFYSNVNPNVDHPRWSQAKERRLGEFRKRPTR